MLILILTFLFILFQSLPGDFTDIMVKDGASEESIQKLEEEWGMNEPIHQRYVSYVGNLIQLNAGDSLQFRTPVMEYIQPKMVNSFILIAPAITLTYILGSIIGALQGINRGSRFEKYGLIPIMIVGTIPSFFLAILFVIVFSAWFGLFPAGSMFSTETIRAYSDAPWWRPYFTFDFGYHYILPFTVIILRYLLIPTLVMRTNVIETAGQEFMRYYRITGLPFKNRFRHVIKHASLPVITIYPISMTRAFGGLVLIETVFNWPGIGHALVLAVLSRDFPVAQFVFFIIAAFVIIANFMVDIIYGFIDPRTRHSS